MTIWQTITLGAWLGLGLGFGLTLALWISVMGDKLLKKVIK